MLVFYKTYLSVSFSCADRLRVVRVRAAFVLDIPREYILRVAFAPVIFQNPRERAIGTPLATIGKTDPKHVFPWQFFCIVSPLVVWRF